MVTAKTRRDEVLDAATRVFLEFGYGRTTMGDIAKATGISRPGLYLVFPSKQEIFTAVLRRALDAELDEIRRKLAKPAAPGPKLLLALDVWCVRKYELTRTATGPSDLYASSFEFANEVAVRSTAAFEALLAEVLAPLARPRARVTLTAAELARMISSASIGFKATANSAKNLRANLRNLVSVVLASLDA